MPLIIGDGLGRDDQVIIQRIVASEIVATVTLEETLRAEVVPEETPEATVSVAPIPVVGTVVVEDVLRGTVESPQPVIGVLKEEGPLMAFENNRVTMFIRDDRTLAASVNYPDGRPVDLTGAKVWFTVKDRAKDPDSQARILKKNLAAGGSDDEILILTPATDGKVEVYIVPADTENIDPATYRYDIQVIVGGKTYTVVRDQITFKEDVTKATS